MKRYVLVPGYVRSDTDRDVHYISAARLAQLYGVRLDECYIMHGDARDYGIPENLPRLVPRRDGCYSEMMGGVPGVAML